MIAKRSPSPVDMLMFVDAGIPPATGEADLVPPAFFDHLRGLAPQGRLPKWEEWFDDDVMSSLVDDPDLRAAASAEMPELPLSYFAERVPVPKSWTRIACTYLLLSEPYGSDLLEAGTRGWPTAVEAGQHLDILNRPQAIADTMRELAATI